MDKLSKKVIFSITLIFIGLGGIVSTRAAESSTDPYANSLLLGIVNSNSTPLSGARVNVYDTSFSILHTVLTDNNGEFGIVLPAGTYYLSAEFPGYVKRFYRDAYISANSSRIIIYPQQILRLNLNLERGGSISGAISSDRTTAVEFLVSAVKINTPNAGWQKDEWVSISGSGNYVIQGLLPGYYRVFTRGAGFLTEYFPEAHSFEQAATIQVTVGSTTGGIDFSLIQPGSGRVTGRVFDIGVGAPRPDIRVVAYQWDPDGYDPCKVSCLSDQNGNFDLELTAGSYYLMAVVDGSELPLENYRTYYNNRYNAKLADPLMIAHNAIIEGVNFNINSLSRHNLEISGNLIGQSNQIGIAGAIVTAIDVFTGHAISRAVTDQGGEFTIGNLPSGHYILEVKGPGLVPTFWPSVLSWQSAEVFSMAGYNVDLYNGGAITQDYGTPGLSIAGKITGPLGPLANARVYAVSISSDLISYALTDNGGNYFIASGLSEGAYRVFADLYGYVGAYYGGLIMLDLAQSPRHEDIDIELQPAAHSVQEVGVNKPNLITLLGNYPNPFNSKTAIVVFSMSGDDDAIDIYDIAGRRVRSINSEFKIGLNEIIWDGRNEFGETVSTGIYFYRLSKGSMSKAMLLLK